MIGTRATPLGLRNFKATVSGLGDYDLDALSFLAAKYPHLLKELEELTREAFAFSDTEEPVPSPTDIETDLSAPSHAPPITPRAPPPEKKGDAIVVRYMTSRPVKPTLKNSKKRPWKPFSIFSIAI